jgi:Ca2+/Na+ antiporter
MFSLPGFTGIAISAPVSYRKTHRIEIQTHVYVLSSCISLHVSICRQLHAVHAVACLYACCCSSLSMQSTYYKTYRNMYMYIYTNKVDGKKIIP